MVAAIVTWLATFVVRKAAKRFSIIVMPDDRRVHEAPTPTIGGSGMFAGFLVAMAVASQLPGLHPVFRGNSEPLGLVIGAAVIFAVGLIDDVHEMSPPAKVSGQVLAGMVLYLSGVTMIFFHVPILSTTVSLSPQASPLVTVLWVVGMANAINLIDGLDGLAAGIVAIASITFFVYAHALLSNGDIGLSNSGPLVAIVCLGLCLGFLAHNFPHPARIFMGDAGAMLLGLLMAASTMSVVGQTPEDFSSKTYFLFAPIVIPFIILGIPILDTAFALLRRGFRGGNPAVADKNHLHHRLMKLGHGHTWSVVLLWVWTAILSAVVVYPELVHRNTLLVPIGVVALGVVLYTLFAPRGRQLASARTTAGAHDAPDPPTAASEPATAASKGQRTGAASASEDPQSA